MESLRLLGDLAVPDGYPAIGLAVFAVTAVGAAIFAASKVIDAGEAKATAPLTARNTLLEAAIGQAHGLLVDATDNLSNSDLPGTRKALNAALKILGAVR